MAPAAQVTLAGAPDQRGKSVYADHDTAESLVCGQSWDLGCQGISGMAVGQWITL